MNFENIKVSVTGRTAVLMMNRPQAMNALNRKLIDEMDAAVDDIAGNREIRALVISGEKHFAAGADISAMIEMDPEGAKAFAFNTTYLKIENLDIPTIAAIPGFALGGGLELALSCDIRIASPDAKLGFPEINIGIFPGAGGTQRLPRLIGAARAKEMIFYGSPIDSQRALQYGLVNEISDNPLEAALKIADKLSLKPRVALKLAKQCINFTMKSTLPAGIEMEAASWASLFATFDQKEGMRAFMEKRKPQFKGN